MVPARYQELKIIMLKADLLKKAKTLDLYKRVIDKFPDANLVEVKSKNNPEDS